MDRAYQSNYDDYKNAIKECVLNKEQFQSEEEFNQRFLDCRRIYLNNVSAQIGGVLKGAERTVWARRCLAVSNPTVAGLPPINEKFEYSAGMEYCIVYYSFIGEKADPKEAIEQNHIFAGYVEKAINEIENELFPPNKENGKKEEKRKGAPYWLVAILGILSCVFLISSVAMWLKIDSIGGWQDIEDIRKAWYDIGYSDGKNNAQRRISYEETGKEPVSFLVYVTEHGEKYHSLLCQYAVGNSEGIPIDDAIAQGYEPCSVCNPIAINRQPLT